jgi:hypothetical protein
VVDAAAAATKIQAYLDRLITMIPGEVIGLYLVGSGMIDPRQAMGLAIWTAICAVGVVAVRAWGSKDPQSSIKPGPDWTLVGISTVAFIIWVYSIGGPSPHQLRSEELDRGMSGAPVLDQQRNLVVGLVAEVWRGDASGRNRDTAWAANARDNDAAIRCAARGRARAARAWAETRRCRRRQARRPICARPEARVEQRATADARVGRARRSPEGIDQCVA